jgi:predicted dehydrogenase/nucleoside-diphosphate-sugar epimerase
MNPASGDTTDNMTAPTLDTTPARGTRGDASASSNTAAHNPARGAAADPKNSGPADLAGRALRVALIGCGKMGLQHLRAIKAVGGASVVGVADPFADPSALTGLVAADCVIAADPGEMLQRVRPDVVHIVTPPSTHAALAALALEAGCHVYVEKPFVPTREEAEVVLELAAKRGLLVSAGHQYLFERPAMIAREQLTSIGKLVHVESYFSFRMVRRTITPVEQAKDILPHAVYPIIDQLRRGTGLPDDEIEIKGIDARSTGDVYTLLRLGDTTGIVLVTLSGRPVEQYQHLCGTAGWMRADYVTGGVIRLLGPGAGLGILFTPFRRALRTLSGATTGIWRLVFKRKTSYPGLTTLVERFYGSIRGREASPMTPRSILDTVTICERIGQALDEAEQRQEKVAATQLAARTQALPPVQTDRGTVLVTGGTGLLGKRVAEELRHAGFAVRVLSRRVPRFSTRLPGVDYVAGDLARPLAPDVVKGVTLVAHCAAETAGGQQDHERNSIAATRNVIEAAARAGVKRVVHISSLAVLKPGREVGGPLDESSPLDAGNLGRGPYVWGKAESEVLVQNLGRELGVDVRIIRPGPLVDYDDFHAPGRLGREVGTLFVAIGGKRSPLSVCDVGTAARVIRSYAESFDAAPPLVNLVEAPPPVRRDLARRMLATRPDLRVVWFPAWLLRLLSSPLKLAQRIALGSAKPIDVYAAFASERYQTGLAAMVIEKAGPTKVMPQHANDRSSH